MSTTTAADLLARADRLARDLVHCPLPPDAAAWETCDTTVCRLLRELVGPARTGSGACSRTRSALLQMLHAYPTPVRPPLNCWVRRCR